jgi:hypothetical protein
MTMLEDGKRMISLLIDIKTDKRDIADIPKVTVKKKEPESLESAIKVEKDGFTDNFSDSTLNGRWKWTREPDSWNLTSSSNFLKIIVSDLPLSMLIANAPSDDFQVDIKMQLQQSVSRGGSAGLIITSDRGDSAYLRFIFEPEQRGTSIMFSTNLTTYRTFYGSNAYLRVIKKGNKVQGFYCSDGNTYNSISELDFYGKTNLKAGIAAGDYFGGSVVALFNYIKVTPLTE